MAREDVIKDLILKALISSRGSFVSGEDISGGIGVSRAALWKYVRTMRQEGCVIEAAPKQGYRIVSLPDTLHGYIVRQFLHTSRIGQGEWYYHDTLDSTNTAAYSLAERGAAEGTVILAEYQRKGKGRLGREWVSPRGAGICLSLVLRPDVAADRIPALTLTAAVSVIETLAELAGVEALVKWPNDVMAGDAKICGILTEVKAQPDMVDFLIFGIGLNVNTPVDSMPDGAASVLSVTGEPADRPRMLASLLDRLEANCDLFNREGFGPILSRCRDHSHTIGRYVTVDTHGRKIQGLAVDIDDRGALVIKQPGGGHESVFSGDVLLCR